jgi:predicted nucleic acid-binding protein
LTRYLLDTSIVADLVRNPLDRGVEHIRRVGKAGACASIIVAAELSEKSGEHRNAVSLGGVEQRRIVGLQRKTAADRKR